MTFRLSPRSLDRLKTCHPDLSAVVMEAIKLTPVDFAVTETLRSIKRQRELLNCGATTTMNSRHLAHPDDGLSRAVDLCALEKGVVSWHWPLYHRIAKAMKDAAAKLNIPLEWGGDWKWPDGPHFQLPWEEYP